METIALQSAIVPFKVPDLFGGLAEGRGIATATPLELRLEFRVKENVLNLIKSSVKEVRIPRAEIGSIRLKRGLFRDKLSVRVKSLTALEDLPGCDNCDITLLVARRDREQSDDMVVLLGGVPSR
jgi:hypothetical protein